MKQFFLRRAGTALLTFVGITIATFALIHAVPGDPVSFYVGRAGMHGVSPETLASIRREFKLDQPLPVQYAAWLRSAATLDFGRSIVHRRPVAEVIGEKLPNTFQLNVLALFVALLAGLPVGVWSAQRVGSGGERAISSFLFLLYSLPAFWVALLLIQWLSVERPLLPLMGMVSDQHADLGFGAKVVDRARHLLLPVITLSYAQVAIVARFTRGALLEVTGREFVTAARARGAGPLRVMWIHAFRNALVPLVTLLGLTVPYLLSGSVIVEQIFQWDGVGLLYFESILARDYPMVMALTVVTALVTLAASILTDALYAVADPRVRLSAEGAAE